MENKYWKESARLATEFNALTFEERTAQTRLEIGGQLRMLEQLKVKLRNGFDRQIAEITRMEDSLLDQLNGIEKEMKQREEKS